LIRRGYESVIDEAIRTGGDVFVDRRMRGRQPRADRASNRRAAFHARLRLEPYKIHQLPDFLMHSTARKDIVIQRSVFNPGAGPWHTHPGPSFIYVLEGEIKLRRFNHKQGCFETPVYRAGEAYSEIADEVHRAVVMSATPAVVLVTRFNIPVGAPVTVPAADPGC
jgi:quercetin dioxygenase-like cupin family protein